MPQLRLKQQMIHFIHQYKQYLEENQLVPLIRIAYNVLPFNQFKYDLEIILEVLDCDLESIYTQAAAEIIVEEELPLQGGKEHVDRLLNLISIEYWRKTNSTLIKRYLIDHQTELHIRCIPSEKTSNLDDKQNYFVEVTI